MITAFDRSNLPQVRADIDAALKQVEAKHGITLSLKNISFSPDGAMFTSKIEAHVKTATGNKAMPREFKNFISTMTGIPADKVETVKITDPRTRKVYTITGYNNRAQKNPIEITDENGGRARAGFDYVKAYAEKLPA